MENDSLRCVLTFLSAVLFKDNVFKSESNCFLSDIMKSMSCSCLSALDDSAPVAP